MIRLMNSAMMPAEGSYILGRISTHEFADRVQLAAAVGTLRSYIGYQQTAEQVRALTGVEIPVSREQTMLEDGDEMLIVKLAYRVQDPALKGQGVSADAFEFFHAVYTSPDSAYALSPTVGAPNFEKYLSAQLERRQDENNKLGVAIAGAIGTLRVVRENAAAGWQYNALNTALKELCDALGWSTEEGD